MIENPWFSIKIKHGSAKTTVYHQNTSCTSGKTIDKNHHRYGTDDRPLCKQCARLSEVGR